MSFKSRENGEMQDMYRRTLASSWAAQAGELPADECIENIFAGGSGWGDRDEKNEVPTTKQPARRRDHDEDDSGSISESERTASELRKQKSDASRSGHRSASSKGRSRSNHARDQHHAIENGESGSSSQQSHSGLSPRKDRRSAKPAQEVDEFEVREDLRSWRLPMTG